MKFFLKSFFFFALFLAALLFLFPELYQKEESLLISAESLKRLHFIGPEHAWLVERREGEWWGKKETDWEQLDSAELEEKLKALNPLELSEALEVSSDNQEVLKKYGLYPYQFRFKILTQTGEESILDVGYVTPLKDNYYARLSDGAGIVLLSQYHFKDLMALDPVGYPLKIKDEKNDERP
jgi:hypothetical protein